MSDTQLETYLDAIAGYPAFFAYNANVDAIVDVDENLEAVLDPPDIDEPPNQLRSLSDLSAALARAFGEGASDEIAISDDLGAEMAETIEPDEQRLGGQAGIMSNVVSVLNASPVFYTYMCSERQRSMFARPDRVLFPTVVDGDLQLTPLSTVTNAERTKINWIFEFNGGDTFFGRTASESRRLIAAARPESFNLETEIDDYADRIASLTDCAMLSGYHSLKREYADGTGYRPHVENGRAFIDAMRAANGDLRIQLEYGVTHYEGLREAVNELIVPAADALSIDSNELRILLSDLEVDVPDHDRQEAIVDRYHALEALRRYLDLPAVNLHATDYFMTVHDDRYLPPAHVQEGWEFAALVAGTKASRGRITEPSDLEVGATHGFSDVGRSAIPSLAEYLGVEPVPQYGTGVAGDPVDGEKVAIREEGVVAVPNRKVPNPTSTVGIGDAVAATSFTLANALGKDTIDPTVVTEGPVSDD